MKDIFLTICIPTFNRASFIKDCIDSILNQDYNLYEIIICDNQSTDDTKSIVDSFSDIRIKYLMNDRNYGLWGNHNQCIQNVKGDWIIFLHSDEKLVQGALRLFAEHIIQNINNQNIGIICSLVDKYNLQDLKTKFYFSSLLDSDLLFLSILYGIGHPSGMCFQKKALLDAKGFDTDSDLYTFSDHYLLAKVADANFSFLFIENQITNYECGPHQDTSKITSSVNYISLITFFNKIQKSKYFENACLMYLSQFKFWKQNPKKFLIGMSAVRSRRLKIKFLQKSLYDLNLLFSFPLFLLFLSVFLGGTNMVFLYKHFLFNKLKNN